jgi:cephalosporin hydroxylase
MKKTLLFYGLLAAISPLFSFDARITEWQNYQNEVLRHQRNLEGWCSVEKAKSMMDLIYELQPTLCVEIGVFGGSSIYPTASALKFLQKGEVYAIDPWETNFCLEGYEPDNPNYIWWREINLNEIHLGFLMMLNRFQLNSYCTVIRATGLQALDRFQDESIDILHIDGNHTENSALTDAERYFPKVKKGGYIWLDDVNWSTVSRAKEFLFSNSEKIERFSNDGYFLFKK